MKGRVLIVDDESVIRRMVSLKLGFAGCECIEAKNGFECVERALADAPDLILLDLMMPQCDGSKAYAELQKHEPTREIPVILLTARDDLNDEQREGFSGVAEHLVKPVSLDRLLQAVSRILEA